MKMVAPLEVGISVSDLERMIEFYRDVLGLDYINLHDMSPEKGAAATICAKGYRVARLQAETGERIKLLQAATPPESRDSAGDILQYRGPVYLTFIVDDLDNVIHKLKAHGVHLRTGDEKVEVREGTFLVFAEDPEGNYVEFVEYGDIKAYRPDYYGR